MSTESTQQRILDSAEKLIATNGFGATSLRAIIKDAGVNLASIHYHFGSREGLLEAVLERRARPVNEKRLAMLDELEGRGAVTVDGVIEAFVRPMTDLLADPDAVQFPRLMGRMLSEPREEIDGILTHQFGDVFRRFAAAFKRALPALSDDEVQWRIHFLIGAMAFGVVRPRMNAADDGPAPHEMVERLIRFASAGMQAPMPVPSSKERR